MDSLTPQQLAAITSDAWRLSVQAGPGSGKTRVLVERIVRRALGGQLDLARTLAITFTENAAAEVKARLAERLERPGLEEQQQRLERAHISTIHGFCARLLREYAIEAGVDPRFQVLDEIRSTVLKQATLNGVLEQWRQTQPERFLAFARHFKRGEYKRQLLGVYDTIRELGGDPLDRVALFRSPTLPFTPEETEAEQRASSQREAVAELLGEFHRDYGQRKRRLSALDFEDLEQSTRGMLRAWPDVAGRISRRFEEILVDEYQDTSPVQSEIFQSLALHCRLFVVGDPAQSIYGFRNADPAGFEAAWKEAGEFQGQVELRDDFRSRPEIIHAVNRHFEEMFRRAGTPFVTLEAGSPFAPKEQPSVEILLVGLESSKKADVQPLEARHLARRIRQLIESGSLSITNQKRDDCGRPLGYGDVAMLFRSATDIKTYERALEDAGIPYFSETGRGFYEAREVRDVVSFLRVLDNPRNEIALAATLRSPMFGLSDDALYLLAEHAHGQKGRVLADIVLADIVLADTLEETDSLDALPAEDAERLREFRNLLERLRGEAPWRPLAELVRDIVQATSYETTLLLEPDGRRKVANLRKLSEVADALEKSGFGSLQEFAEAVDRFHAEGVREGEAQLDAATEGAVRLMTMHAAKGLEFPVVVLPDLTRQPLRESSALEFLPEFGLGVKLAQETGTEKSPTLERIHEELERREQAERNRVFYVAVTRAQEQLLLSGCLNRTQKEFRLRHALGEICDSYGIVVSRDTVDRQWRTVHVQATGQGFSVALLATDEELGAAYQQELSVAERHGMALAAGSSLELPLDGEAEADAQRLAKQALAVPPEAERSDFLTAVTDVVEFHGCPRRYYLSRYLGYERGGIGNLPALAAGAETGEETEAADDEFPRTEVGRAVHRVLALGSGALPALPASLRTEAERLAQRFWQSSYGQLTNAAGTAASDVRRELPLMAAGIVPQQAGALLRGTLDLLTFANGRPDLLLDYKANDIPADQVETEAAHYRVQMLLYALLVEAVFGALPGEAVLFFLTPGVAHRVELTPAALEEARRGVAEFFTAQREARFPPLVARHCFRCAFSGTVCLAPQRAGQAGSGPTAS